MQFLVHLAIVNGNELSLNYPYPLSAALYRIIAKGDAKYAAFLHNQGYGKGFKLFTFSEIRTPYSIKGDKMLLKGNEASLKVAFHLPQAMESFVKGLFKSEEIVVADRNTKVTFRVKSVESMMSPLQQYQEREIVNICLRPLSPVVAGLMKDNGKYDFLPPDDPRFAESLIYNWRSKIETCYDKATAQGALLIMEQKARKLPPRSRLITVKAGTEAETKIRGWMNVDLSVTAEKRFIEILLNAGVGVYNAQGMGYVEEVKWRVKDTPIIV